MRIIWITQRLSRGHDMLQREQTDRLTDKRKNRQPAIERGRQKVAMNMSHILNHNLLHNLSAAQVAGAGTIWLIWEQPPFRMLHTTSLSLF